MSIFSLSLFSNSLEFARYLIFWDSTSKSAFESASREYLILLIFILLLRSI
jgi:hypothetical protein